MKKGYNNTNFFSITKMVKIKNHIVLFRPYGQRPQLSELSPEDTGKCRKFKKPKISYILEKDIFSFYYLQ